MANPLAAIVFVGLALIAIGYGWVLVLGTFVLASIYMVLSGAGTLLSSLVVSGVYSLRSRRRPDPWEESI